EAHLSCSLCRRASQRAALERTGNGESDARRLDVHKQPPPISAERGTCKLVKGLRCVAARDRTRSNVGGKIVALAILRQAAEERLAGPIRVFTKQNSATRTDRDVVRLEEHVA